MIELTEEELKRVGRLVYPSNPNMAELCSHWVEYSLKYSRELSAIVEVLLERGKE